MTFMSDMTYGGIHAEPGNHAFREIVRYTIALHVINAHVIEVTENAKLHCSTHTTRTPKPFEGANEKTIEYLDFFIE